MSHDASLDMFLKCMGFKPKPSIRSVTEYALYCKVPLFTFLSPSKLDEWENEILVKAEELLLSPNGPTIISIYKARRYSFKGRILAQPRKIILFLFVTVIYSFTAISDLKEEIASFLWRHGW